MLHQLFLFIRIQEPVEDPPDCEGVSFIQIRQVLEKPIILNNFVVNLQVQSGIQPNILDGFFLLNLWI